MTGSYLLLLLRAGAGGALRAMKDLRGVLVSPAVLGLGMVWHLLSGVGYLAGYVTASAPEGADGD
jgi:hypothetical protein